MTTLDKQLALAKAVFRLAIISDGAIWIMHYSLEVPLDWNKPYPRIALVEWIAEQIEAQLSETMKDFLARKLSEALATQNTEALIALGVELLELPTGVSGE